MLKSYNRMLVQGAAFLLISWAGRVLANDRGRRAASRIKFQ
jgi:hypothetical protein